MPAEKVPPTRLKGFFLNLTERSFGQLGLGERQIVEYVASVLTDFAHSDRWMLLRDAEGRRLGSVVEMLLSTAASDDRSRVGAERALRKYVGDYTLFMSGLFRSYVERGGYLSYYFEEGKRSYQLVSQLDLAMCQPGFLLFDELGRRFEYYSGALDYMRRCFFPPTPKRNPFAGFLEQIQDWVKAGRPEN
jgi:hypothetical protein